MSTSPNHPAGQGQRTTGQGETIRAILPSRLRFRDLAIRLVASACKLVPRGGDSFSNEIVSAFSEALNNVVLHGGGATDGHIEIEIDVGADHLTMRILDQGAAFDPRTVPPPILEDLPESGMGAFIIMSFMDDVNYVAGPPNVLTLTKWVGGSHEVLADR